MQAPPKNRIYAMIRSQKGLAALQVAETNPGFRRRPSPPGPRSRLGPERARAAPESAHAPRTAASRPPLAEHGGVRARKLRGEHQKDEKKKKKLARRCEEVEEERERRKKVGVSRLAHWPSRGGDETALSNGRPKKPTFYRFLPPSTLRYLGSSTSFLTVAQAAHLRHPRK